ncbi:Gfo/Idh/MocA family protein [Leifsonia sp. NPDC058194]|uniref:Gfo/Idh/MocA family protein n=1 Tax=Leifsonia sp. NPDC058194 TaxID=3346374 RepID=UPI0036DF9940
MAKPLSIAAIGFWHVHASDYATAAQQHPGTELVAVWDDDEHRGRQAAADYGVEFVGDLDELLARPGLDGVTVTTATNQHRDVILRALAAGKHVFTEKVLAATAVDAEELVATAAAARLALVVSLPRLYDGYTRALEGLLDSGALGALTYSRVRLTHDGWVAGWLPERFGDPEAAQGGAFIDLGCHPVYLTRLFHRADPLTVAATYGHVTGRPVEDNAVVTETFPGGGIGVLETSVVARPHAFAVELRGTEASALYDGERLLVSGGVDGEGWTELPVPEAVPGAFDQWVGHIHAGAVAEVNLRHALELTRVIEAATVSAATGTVVTLR